MKIKDELAAQLEAVNLEWDAKRRAIQHLRSVDRVLNEGGEGYSAYEAAAARLADEYLPRVSELTNAIFAAEWTADVTADRRETWNGEIRKMGAKITPGALKALITRLGYGQADIVRAKALHGIK